MNPQNTLLTQVEIRNILRNASYRSGEINPTELKAGLLEIFKADPLVTLYVVEWLQSCVGIGKIKERDSAHETGYNSGYSEGYDEGYQEGYDSGVGCGYAQAKRDLTKNKD